MEDLDKIVNKDQNGRVQMASSIYAKVTKYLSALTKVQPIYVNAIFILPIVIVIFGLIPLFSLLMVIATMTYLSSLKQLRTSFQQNLLECKHLIKEDKDTHDHNHSKRDSCEKYLENHLKVMRRKSIDETVDITVQFKDALQKYKRCIQTE